MIEVGKLFKLVIVFMTKSSVYWGNSFTRSALSQLHQQGSMWLCICTL